MRLEPRLKVPNGRQELHFAAFGKRRRLLFNSHVRLHPTPSRQPLSVRTESAELGYPEGAAVHQ
jgi:hypothetical protein